MVKHKGSGSERGMHMRITLQAFASTRPWIESPQHWKAPHDWPIRTLSSKGLNVHGEIDDRLINLAGVQLVESDAKSSGAFRVCVGD